MKRILGIDVGVSSVGIAIIKDDRGKKDIEKLAVRIIPEDPDFQGKFYSGNTASKNASRTEKRSIRRNNQRFKARRDQLYTVLKENNMFPTDELLYQLNAKELYCLRAKAAIEKISLQELGRVLILLNQRRGFLSNRKSISEEETSSEFKEKLANLEQALGGKTIGQHLYEELSSSNGSIDVIIRERTYLRSSYLHEFDQIWTCQKQFHKSLTGGMNSSNNGTLYDEIRNRIIFYQRPLKSQKGLVSECPFEKHHKAVVKSSPYFELFRIWQKVNDLTWTMPDGEICVPSMEQKATLKNALWVGENLNKQYKLTASKIKVLLGFSSRAKIYLNFNELDGSRTYSVLKKALDKAEVKSPEQYLFFNTDQPDEKGGLFELWHITYSIPNETDVINTLAKRFPFTHEQATIIAKAVAYKADYGNLSTRAIRKLLPALEQGKGYCVACDNVGYDHSGYKTDITLQSHLTHIPQNELRNPVVEQVLNQVVNIVNQVIDNYGKVDEIRVELARELRNNAKTRKRLSQLNSRNKKANDKIRDKLLEEHGFKIVNGRDIKRYILWEETNKLCLYCHNNITGSDLLSGNAEIEHILPRSRSFSDAMSNYILAHRRCNSDKDQRTAYDYMESKGEQALEEYIAVVNNLYADGGGKISRAKFENLMCKGEDIPDDFVERMKKDSQYIAKETVKLLKSICPDVYTTTGQVTNFLREEWQLKHLLQELGLEKYRKLGQIETKQFKDENGSIRTYESIKDWSKRDDHRHHAVDALICALTDQKIIFKLNNLNKIYQYEKEALEPEELKDMEEFLSKKLDLQEFSNQIGVSAVCPIPEIRSKAKQHLEEIFISFKKDNSKVLTRKVNKLKNGIEQETWVPRGRLHEETVMGKIQRIATQKLKISALSKLGLEECQQQIQNIVSPNLRAKILTRLNKYQNPKQAFNRKTLTTDPLEDGGNQVTEVAVYEKVGTKRVALDENISPAQIKKIVDQEVKQTIVQRLDSHNGKIKEAFRNLSENPVVHKNGKVIRSLTVYDESKVEQVRNGYVKTGTNHHALVYLNDEGKYQDKVISTWEAVNIGLMNIEQTGKPYPIIERNNHSELGVFQFSMQKNDLFVLDLIHSENPQEEKEINYLDPKNRNIISRNLFRVQKFSKSGSGRFLADFRHHLETTIDRNDPKLKYLTWFTISKNSDLARLTKIRLNHLGDVVHIGE